MEKLKEKRKLKSQQKRQPKPPRRPPKRKNEVKKFRNIKQEIRILGVDDAPFTPHTHEQVMLVGTVLGQEIG
jgi:hypothetical protein